MLLEEAGLGGAVGAAHERERPAGDVRQHAAGDGEVVVGEGLLGEAGFGVEDLGGVGEADGGMVAVVSSGSVGERFAAMGREAVWEAFFAAMGCSLESTVRPSNLRHPDLSRSLGVGAEVSRVTSAAGLSSRRPRKAAWRTRLSAVQVAKRTCATSVGLTQYAPVRASAGGFSNGVEDCARGSSLSRRSLWVFSVKPVPTRPA